jgi:DNA-directed RNA polymerase subunit RPC12/RpoP
MTELKTIKDFENFIISFKSGGYGKCNNCGKDFDTILGIDISGKHLLNAIKQEVIKLIKYIEENHCMICRTPLVVENEYDGFYCKKCKINVPRYDGVEAIKEFFNMVEEVREK